MYSLLVFPIETSGEHLQFCMWEQLVQRGSVHDILCLLYCLKRPHPQGDAVIREFNLSVPDTEYPASCETGNRKTIHVLLFCLICKSDIMRPESSWNKEK